MNTGIAAGSPAPWRDAMKSRLNSWRARSKRASVAASS
jgi:hypothetical protein